VNLSVRAGYKPSSVCVVIHLRSGVATRLLRSLPIPPPRSRQSRDGDSKGPFSRRNLFDLAQGGVFQA